MARRFGPRPGRAASFAIDGDLAWVLERALGGERGPRAFPPAFPPAFSPNTPPDPARAVALAQRLGIVPRLVARSSWDDLCREVGQGAARELALEHAAAEARDAQILALARAVSGMQERVVLLKFAALRAAGILAPGARHASDLDVLVAQGHAEPLAARLEGEGFARSSVPAYEHHLPALAHPERGMVEIHTAIPGVRVAGRRFARLEDLERAGLLESLESVAEMPGAFVPRRDVLAAHVLAHGLAQHGSAPTSYPPLHMVGDLCDLGSTAVRLAGRWVARDVGAAAVAAAARLVEELPEGVPPQGAGRTLLDALLRGALEAREQRARKLSFARPLSDRPWLAAYAAQWRRVLFPSAAELGVIYGPPGRFGGVARQRARRPVDIVWRSLRSLVARAVPRRP